MQNSLIKKSIHIKPGSSHHLPRPCPAWTVYISVNRTIHHTHLSPLVTPQIRRLRQYCTRWKEKERIDKGSARSINKHSFRRRAGLPLTEDLCHCPHKVKEGGLGKGTVSFPTAGGQIDEGEYVKLDEDGETQEDSIHQQTNKTQTLVQLPLVQMYTENLRERKGRWWELDSKDICLNKCF